MQLVRPLTVPLCLLPPREMLQKGEKRLQKAADLYIISRADD